MAKTFNMLMNDDRIDFPTEMQTFEQLFNQLSSEQQVQFAQYMRRERNDLERRHVQRIDRERKKRQKLVEYKSFGQGEQRERYIEREEERQDNEKQKRTERMLQDRRKLIEGWIRKIEETNGT